MNNQEMVTLSCGLYGDGRVRPVKAALTATALHLGNIVVSELGTQQGRVVLYLARDVTGKYLPHDDDARKLLRGPVSHKYDPLPLLAQLNDPLSFGADFSPEPNEIHLLVELLEEEPLTKKRRLSDDDEAIESIGLSGVWDFSELTLTQLQKQTEEIAAILRRPLPFRLQMADTALADRICNQDGPKVRCQVSRSAVRRVLDRLQLAHGSNCIYGDQAKVLRRAAPHPDGTAPQQRPRRHAASESQQGRGWREPPT